MHKGLIVAALILIAVPAFWYSVERAPDLNRQMKDAAQLISDLFPYMFEPDKLEQEKNRKFVKNKVLKLNAAFTEMEDHFKDRIVSNRISYRVMKQHLIQTAQLLEGPYAELASKRLQATTSICMSCHTQDRVGSMFFHELKRDAFKDDFQYAEYLYMTRNYTNAIKYYDQYIDENQKEYDIKMITAFKRELKYFVNITKRPQKGIIHFREHLDSAIPALMKNDIKNWVEGLEKWDSYQDFVEPVTNFVDLQRFVAVYIDPLESGEVPKFSGHGDVVYLRLSQLIFDYLRGNPAEEEVPQLLYWLALCDRALNYNYFFNLADLYLVECFESYPDHPFGEKCRAEYEKNQHFPFKQAL